MFSLSFHQQVTALERSKEEAIMSLTAEHKQTLSRAVARVEDESRQQREELQSSLDELKERRSIEAASNQGELQ